VIGIFVNGVPLVVHCVKKVRCVDIFVFENLFSSTFFINFDAAFVFKKGVLVILETLITSNLVSEMTYVFSTRMDLLIQKTS